MCSKYSFIKKHKEELRKYISDITCCDIRTNNKGDVLNFESKNSLYFVIYGDDDEYYIRNSIKEKVERWLTIKHILDS